MLLNRLFFFFFQAEDGIRNIGVTGVQTCALPIFLYIKFDNPLIYAFTAAVFVSVASEILARVMKQPAIVFIIPGILPLVPGITLYNTVLYTIQKDYIQAANAGTRAIIISIGISLGILVVASLSRMFNIYKLKKAFSNNAANKYVSWVNIGKIRTNNEYLVDKNEMNESLNSMDLDLSEEEYSVNLDPDNEKNHVENSKSVCNTKPINKDKSDTESDIKNL